MFVLAKSPPATRPSLLLNARKYINVEDALSAIRIEDTWKDKGNTKEDQKGRKRHREDYSSSYDSAKFKNDEPKRMVNFTPLVKRHLNWLMNLLL